MITVIIFMFYKGTNDGVFFDIEHVVLGCGVGRNIIGAHAHIIDRGYEDLEQRLQDIGAQIERVAE